MKHEQLIRARGVYDSERQAYAADAVLVQEGRIAAVGGFETLRAAAPQAPVADLSGLYLLPGLINTHVHLEFDSTEQARLNYLAEPEEVRFLRAARNARDMLCSGVTTLRDAGSGAGLLRLFEAQEKELLPMPRLRLCGQPLTITSGHLHFLGSETDGVDEIIKAVRLRKKQGCTDVKLVVTGGQMTPGSGPERTSYTLEEIRAATREAEALEMSTFAHCLTTDGFVNSARGGVGCIEHAACFVRNKGNGLLERIYEPEKMEEFRGSGQFFMTGVSAHYSGFAEVRGKPEQQTPREAFLLAQEQRECEIVGKYMALGFVPVLGTDAGVTGTYFDESWLEAALFVERCGMSNAEAIATGTTHAADCLGLGEETGRIAAGYAADIIALTEDPLADIRALGRVERVMYQGQWVEE